MSSTMRMKSKKTHPKLRLTLSEAEGRAGPHVPTLSPSKQHPPRASTRSTASSTASNATSGPVELTRRTRANVRLTKIETEKAPHPEQNQGSGAAGAGRHKIRIDVLMRACQSCANCPLLVHILGEQVAPEDAFAGAPGADAEGCDPANQDENIRFRGLRPHHQCINHFITRAAEVSNAPALWVCYRRQGLTRPFTNTAEKRAVCNQPAVLSLPL